MKLGRTVRASSEPDWRSDGSTSGGTDRRRLTPVSVRRCLAGLLLTALAVSPGCSQLGDLPGVGADEEVLSSNTVPSNQLDSGRADQDPSQDGETNETAGSVQDTSTDGGSNGESDGATSGEVDADAEVELSTATAVSYVAGTCYAAARSDGEPVEVPCSQPHRLEVYATGDLEGEPGAPYQGLDVAFALCDPEFRAITGIGIGLATLYERLVLKPSEETWAEGARTVICYVHYPEAVSRPLSEIDPVRSFGLVSVFGLELGDCLAEYDQDGTQFVPVSCDLPHEGEVFVDQDLPDGPFPGFETLNTQADELCFGQPFEDFVGLNYAESEIFSAVSVPTEQSWSGGDRTINCILTSSIAVPGSLQGSGR